MTTYGRATGKSERLSVLNDAEQEALYGLPDFDEGQQQEFLSLSAAELELATRRIRRQLPRPHRDNYSGLFVI